MLAIISFSLQKCVTFKKDLFIVLIESDNIIT